MGAMYYGGKGVTQNYETAIKWYKLAAKQGLAKAQNHLERLQKKNSQLEKDRKPSPTVTAKKTPTKKSRLPSCLDSPERFPTYLQ